MLDGFPRGARQDREVDERSHELRQRQGHESSARGKAAVERGAAKPDARSAHARHERTKREHGGRAVRSTQPVGACQDDEKRTEARDQAERHGGPVGDVSFAGMTARKGRRKQENQRKGQRRDDKEQAEIEPVDLVVRQPQRSRIGKRRPGAPYAERHKRKRRPACRQLLSHTPSLPRGAFPLSHEAPLPLFPCARLYAKQG